MQIASQNPNICKAQKVLRSLNSQLQEAQQGIPYSEQVQMTKRLAECERTIATQQMQISQLRKECQLLQESVKSNESSSGKLQSVISVLQRKEQK